MNETLFESILFTPVGSFTEGVEGPACDRAGNLYAVNYARQGTIGKVTPEGVASVFVELPQGSVGNGIRFNRAGDTMFVADYAAHNLLAIDLATKAVRVYAHEPQANQPNDIATDIDDTIYASDPHWEHGDGQIWRIGLDGRFALLERAMGTTNGIEIDMQRRVLYVNETMQQRIWAYDLRPGGLLSNKRLFHKFATGYLDGMRCDLAGNLYVTRYGAGTVAKLSPQGEVLLEVRVSGSNCTNIAFGGPDGRTCYVTVSDQGNVESFRVDQAGQSWWLWNH